MFLGPCNATLLETDEIGITVTRCPAEDFNDATNETSGSTVMYSITAGNQGNTFMVDENGTIKNIVPLDSETVAQYTLLVNATDEAGLSSFIQVIPHTWTHTYTLTMYQENFLLECFRRPVRLQK